MNLLRPDLATLNPYTRPAGEGSPAVRLHMNECARDWPPEARRALLARLENLAFRTYPERQAELTERLRLRLGAPEGGVLLGPSSGALLDLVALAGLRPGDAVAVPDPGFSLYPLLLGRVGARMRPVRVGKGFPLEPWREALAEGVRQLWLTLPNNPTGAWVAPEDLEPLLEEAAARPDPPLVVLDEAYAEFAPRTHRRAVERFPNVLVLRTFSKALASAGWRLGYLLGDPALVGRLAALQLPYSLSASSLEALDVALDFAAAFQSEVRAIVERRDRLARALEAVAAVAPSAANFLRVSPDPADRLAEAGLTARRLPGLDAARITVGTEAEARAVAGALGVALPEPSPLPKRRLLVLDVDGVLLEVGRSFMEAVARALAELRPGIAWSDGDFQAFKRLGGFNNDFRLTAGALVASDVGLMEAIRAGDGRGLAALEARMAELEPSCKAVVQRHYEATRFQEKPTVNREDLALPGWSVAVYTGRPPEEWDLAREVLGFDLPAIADGAPHLRKPQPGGLLQWADAFQADLIVFAGDTGDDARALAEAKILRPELDWRFAAIGPDRARLGGAFAEPTLRDLISLLKEL